MPSISSPKRPEISLTIHNRTPHVLHLTNQAHSFLDPVPIQPSSLGPLAYFPPPSSSVPSTLDFIIRTRPSIGITSSYVYQLSVPRQVRGKGWIRGSGKGWKVLPVVRLDNDEKVGQENQISSSSQQTLAAGLVPVAEATLKAYQVRVS